MLDLDYLFSLMGSNFKERKLLPRYVPSLNNYDNKLCSTCGGKCCKSCGCHFSPNDFKDLSFESLKKELEKGYISIDRIPQEISYDHTAFGTLILRIRNKNSPIVDDYFVRKKQECILLTPNGCLLSSNDRPTGGKSLVPRYSNNEFTCTLDYSISDCSYEWQIYQNILNQLSDYFRNEPTDYPWILPL